VLILHTTDFSDHKIVPDHGVDYFAQEVIGGPSAFVLEPATREDYAVALQRKLVKEIAQSADAPRIRFAY
jgi:Protein of unknown function (DUF1194)